MNAKQIGAVSITLVLIAVALTAYVILQDGSFEESDLVRKYVIVETGQSTFYGNEGVITAPAEGERFHGQDANYRGVQTNYMDNGDGTVNDLNTGLMWQKTPGEKVTYAEAVAGPQSFALAGYDDWRLPTIKQLYSLILFSGIDPSGSEGGDPSDLMPFIDADSFDFEYGDTVTGERIIDAQYWSSTVYVSTTMMNDAAAFGVNFADGRIKGYPTERVGPPGETFIMRSFVRYVRGNVYYGLNSFIENDDGTVIDNATGLTWSKADSGEGMTWEEALAWVRRRNEENYLGHNDWRLPNAKELQSIVDYTRSPSTTNSAAIDPLFNVTAIIDEGGETNYPFYWTGTTHEHALLEGSNAVYIAFGEALGWMPGPFGTTDLLDVHGAGAQRSDPKHGNPADWPDGNGPQGDVVRINNHVRCVRGGTI